MADGLSVPIGSGASAGEPVCSYGAVDLAEQGRAGGTASQGGSGGAKQKKTNKNQPTHVTMKSPDGSTKSVKIGMEPLWGLEWYGAFGLLSCAAVVCAVLALIGVVSTVLGVQAWSPIRALRGLALVVGALTAGFAAYAQEGLKWEVTAMARRGDTYSVHLENFKRQRGALGSVEEQMAQLAKVEVADMGKIQRLQECLQQIDDLQICFNIVDGFVTTEGNRMLQFMAPMRGSIMGYDEVREFVDQNEEILATQIPTLDHKRFIKGGMQHGLGLLHVSLLAAAASSRNAEEKECYVALTMFLLEPTEENSSKATGLLVTHMQDYTEWTKPRIQQELNRLRGTFKGTDSGDRALQEPAGVATSASSRASAKYVLPKKPETGDKRVSDDAAYTFVKAVLRKRPVKEEDEDCEKDLPEMSDNSDDDEEAVETKSASTTSHISPQKGQDKV